MELSKYAAGALEWAQTAERARQVVVEKQKAQRTADLTCQLWFARMVVAINSAVTSALRARSTSWRCTSAMTDPDSINAERVREVLDSLGVYNDLAFERGQNDAGTDKDVLTVGFDINKGASAADVLTLDGFTVRVTARRVSMVDGTSVSSSRNFECRPEEIEHRIVEEVAKLK